ncbi:MAG: glycosyltransferase family 2 protein [Candidatus Micrarchaeota archaeon]|nr:glycosyltransferase family 2 protein [Candidatus Micrarchaeota archaeon]
MANYNGATALYKARSILWHSLNSVVRANYKNRTIVMGDDSSTDKSIAFVRKSFPQVRIVVNRPNGGYTKCMNAAIRYALKNCNPEYLLIMNNDVIIKDRDWLKKMVGAAESDMKVGIVGCKFLYPDGRLQHAGVENGVMVRCRGWNTHDADKYNEIEEVPAVGMVVALVRKSVIGRIGLLDENFYQGSDDLDFCVRATRSGFKVLYDGQVSIIHLEGFTAKIISGEKRSGDFWFPILQINWIYSSFKRLGAWGRVLSIGLALASSFIGIGNRQVRLGSVKFKSRPLWRLKETLKAIYTGYRLYKGVITREQAYGPYLKGK